MKKIILISLCCVLFLYGCRNNQKLNNNTEELEKTITFNLNKIGESSNATSSNPYDYTDNEYYKNIIALGTDAVPVLESMYKNGKLSGVNAYISALAIQEITNCNLYEKYDLDWSTAEEFYTLWENNNCSFKSK